VEKSGACGKRVVAHSQQRKWYLLEGGRFVPKGVLAIYVRSHLSECGKIHLNNPKAKTVGEIISRINPNANRIAPPKTLPLPPKAALKTSSA
jgi:hypothetical protein